MTQFAPEWVAHQQKRFLRHDAHRFLRHDWQRFVKPGAALPWPLSVIVEAKANFDPNQPRVPAGNSDGGQWTDDPSAGDETDGAELEADGSDVDPDEFSDSKRAGLARLGSRPHGHHYVSVKIYGKMKLPEETRKVFDEAKTGQLYAGVHRNSKEHEIYTEAVEQLFKKYMADNNIREEAMTPNQARSFVDQVKRSSDPRIRDFNMRIWRRELLYWIRRGPRGRE